MKLIVTKHAAERMKSFDMRYEKAKSLIGNAVEWEASHHSKKDGSVTMKNGSYLFVLDKTKQTLITVYDQRLNLTADELWYGMATTSKTAGSTQTNRI